MYLYDAQSCNYPFCFKNTPVVIFLKEGSPNWLNKFHLEKTHLLSTGLACKQRVNHTVKWKSRMYFYGVRDQRVYWEKLFLEHGSINRGLERQETWRAVNIVHKKNKDPSALGAPALQTWALISQCSSSWMCVLLLKRIWTAITFYCVIIALIYLSIRTYLHKLSLKLYMKQLGIVKMTVSECCLSVQWKYVGWNFDRIPKWQIIFAMAHFLLSAST